MSDAITSRELIDRLVEQSGIKKKLAAEVLRVIPRIIEKGLLRDGEVRVKGLGTFRLKWIRERIGRNPKTGERVSIPPHNRLVFLPEQALKEFINRDFRLLGYELCEPDAKATESSIIPEPEAVHETAPETLPFHGPVKGPDPEPVHVVRKTKRRIHWIVPVSVIIIAILSVIFYFRNFYQDGDEGQRSAVEGQQSEAEGQQSEAEGQQSEAEGQQSMDSTQNSKLSAPYSGPSTQHSELITVPEGKRFFQLAREVYGNPFLWVLIYQANPDKISDPDMLVAGTELNIPSLEGTAESLARKDSLAVSNGYHLVYNYYKQQNDPRAEGFLSVSEKYKPK